MLSATPTDMGHSMRRTRVMRERKTDPALHPFSAERKENRPGDTGAEKD